MKKSLIATSVITLSLIGLAVLTSPSSTPKTTSSNKSDISTTIQPTQQMSATNDPVVTSSSPTVTSIQPSAPTTAQPVDLVATLKTKVEQTILSYGYDETEVTCFDNLVDKFYNWNVSDQEMTQKLLDINTLYSGYCNAWLFLKDRSTTPAPIGF